MHEALTQRSSGSFQHAQGWGLSLLIHGLAVGVAALLLGDLKLAPQPEPFKWNVAMVEPPLKAIAQPSESEPKPQAKAAAKPAQTPAPKQTEPQPVERQMMVVQAAPPPQAPPTPVAQRQEPIHPVVENKPEPEVKPEPKSEIKPVSKEVKPEVSPRTPLVAKPVEPVEPLVQHPPHHISTQSAEFHRPPVEPVVEQASAHASTHPSTHAEPAPSPPAPSAPAAPMVASVAPSVPAPTIPAHQAAREPAIEPSAPTSALPIQEASATASPAPSGAGRHKAKADFGWVGKALWERVMNLKRYPHMARARHLEGRVVVRAVIREDGQLAKVDVAESSGHEILDLDAIEVLRRAFPLQLKQPLEQPEIVVQIPIIYKLQ